MNLFFVFLVRKWSECTIFQHTQIIRIRDIQTIFGKQRTIAGIVSIDDKEITAFDYCNNGHS